VISDSNVALVMVKDGQALAYRRDLRISGAVTPRSLWMPNPEPAAIAMGRGRCRAASPPPWEFRRGRAAAVIPDGTTPAGRRYRCEEIDFHARAQELLRPGHTDLAGDGDGEACESLR
jgi:hypothetical protein